MNTTITTLEYNQPIRLAGWDLQYATLFTTEGFAKLTNREVETLTWEKPSATFTGTMLSNDPSYYQREKEVFESAVTVDTDSTYLIEGEEYKLVIRRGNEKSPRVSDPFYFEKV